ncbi:MAG: hypothetical protein PVJ02_14730 [Gemmatimonadota bacterium]|jgi:hydrogenase/urease accessory protein HupE
MKHTLRGVVMAAVGMLAGASSLWAHPGHITEGGLWHTVRHIVTSPYHMAVVLAVVVLAVAAALTSRPGRVDEGTTERVEE